MQEYCSYVGDIEIPQTHPGTVKKKACWAFALSVMRVMKGCDVIFDFRVNLVNYFDA